VTEINILQQRLTHTVLMMIAIALGWGCATANAAKKEEGFLLNPDGIEISKAELRIRVRALALPFSGMLEEAADSIIVETTDPEIRKLALMWKINGIPAMQAALFQPKPLAALLDAWALTIQTRDSVNGGPASEIVPDDIQTIALQALNKIGIRKTVAAANETMGDLAARIDVYTTFMPKQARWQAEYLMGEMMAGEDLGTVVSEFTELSNAIEAMAETVSDAPTMITAERTAVLAALQQERIAAIEAINQQMQEAFEFVTHERVEAFTTHLKEERIAVIEAMTAERIAALEALREELIATLEQVESMADTLVADSLKRLIDHAFIRLAQLGIVVLIVVGIGYFALRRRPSHA